MVLPTLAAALLPPPPSGSAEVPSLTMWVDSTRTTLGSPLGLTIRLRYQRGDVALVPDLSTLVEEAVVRPLAVSESEGTDPSAAVAEIDRHYDLRFYQLGHRRIPLVEVAFARSGGDTLIRTAGPLDVEIVAIRKRDDVELRDIKHPVAISGGIPAWLVAAAAVLALVGVGAGATWVARRRRGVTHALSPSAPPIDYAVEFARIAAMGLLERGAFKIYYSLLSETLRRFLEQNDLGVRAMERTTGEIAEAVGGLEISPETVQQITDFLRAADLVKFAHAEPDLAVARQASEAGKRIVGMVLTGAHRGG